MLLSEELKVQKEVLREKRILNIEISEDALIFLNLEKIIRTNIPEFKDVPEIIRSKLYDESLKLFQLKEEFGEDHPHFTNALNNWDLSEGLDAKGNFGSATKGEAGKGMGKVRKSNVIEAIGSILSDILKQIKSNNFNMARMINFFPSVIENVNVDTISDMLLKFLAPNFEKYTKRMISETSISQEYISDNGLILINKNGKIKEEYFYPKEFFSGIPVVGVKDYNALSKFSDYNPAAESSAALAGIFNKIKDEAVEATQEIIAKNKREPLAPSNEEHIFDLLDFRFMASFFQGDKYPVIKKRTIEAMKIVKQVKNIDNTEDKIRKILKQFHLIKYNIEALRLEDEISNCLHPLLSLSFNEENIFKESIKSKGKRTDYEIKDNGQDILLELKITKKPSDIQQLIHLYNNQIESYNTVKAYDKNFYIIWAYNYKVEDYLHLIDSLQESNKELKVNKKWIILGNNEVINASSKSSKFQPISQVIEKEEDINKEIVTNEYIETSLNLRGKIMEISGSMPNTVEKENLLRKLEQVTNKRKDLIEELKVFESVDPGVYEGVDNLTLSNRLKNFISKDKND